ncbi:MAG: hypothetical protein JOZ54_16410 [Acidobacteria bacterium]|nr:hypothetical protein [Acidobacteriota bacterium]
MNAVWRPSRPVALLLGIASLWPPIYMLLFFGVVAMFFLHPPGNSPHSGFPAAFGALFIVHLLTMLLTFALLAAFIVHAFKTDLIAQDKKVLWVVILFFGGIIANPIYWYLYIWKPLRPAV